MFPRVKIHNHTTDRHGKYSGKNDQTRKNEKLKFRYRIPRQRTERFVDIDIRSKKAVNNPRRIKFDFS